ncbi:MAG: DUF2892 domain-containing protein [Spirochaetales bacterium]
MEKNTGTLDRIIRAVLAVGLVITGIVFWSSGWPAWVALAAAVIMAVTASISWCPIWAVFGVKTISVKKL